MKQKRKSKDLLMAMSPVVLRKRLRLIQKIILAAEDRCLAVDGPVSKTIDEMTDADIKLIYEIAKGL